MKLLIILKRTLLINNQLILFSEFNFKCFELLSYNLNKRKCCDNVNKLY